MQKWVLFILLLSGMGCRKAPTEPPGADLNGFVGSFIGSYQELICALPTVPETEIDSVRADVVVAAKNWVGINLIQPSGQVLWSFEALYTNDSTFFIAPFDLGGTTWSGNVRYNEQFTIAMGNRLAPCAIMGDTLATITYRAPR